MGSDARVLQARREQHESAGTTNPASSVAQEGRSDDESTGDYELCGRVVKLTAGVNTIKEMSLLP